MEAVCFQGWQIGFKRRNLLRIASSKIHLFGRGTRVADIPTFHPSCSKQHAIVQSRWVEENQVRPYLIDLGSTNRTFINGSAIEPQRYYELVEKDTIRFGNSSGEYVLLHENSAADWLFLTRDGAKCQNYEDWASNLRTCYFLIEMFCYSVLVSGRNNPQMCFFSCRFDHQLLYSLYWSSFYFYLFILANLVYGNEWILSVTSILYMSICYL